MAQAIEDYPDSRMLREVARRLGENLGDYWAAQKERWRTNRCAIIHFRLRRKLTESEINNYLEYCQDAVYDKYLEDKYQANVAESKKPFIVPEAWKIKEKMLKMYANLQNPTIN